MALAETENLEAYPVAVVTESPRMVMTWKGQTIADLSRAFLNTNGAVKHASVRVERGKESEERKPVSLREMAAGLKTASRRGLVERFDSTIGAGSVLMPFGGKTQRTPAQAMAALLPVLPGQETDQASVMAWGCDPDKMSADPYQGAYDAVSVSLAKLVAVGADYRKAYLTLQEFFEKLREEPQRWGKPAAALLGALDAQLDYAAAAIGGKDSMSGSFMDLDVPPTLISFAIAPIKAGEVLSPEFKEGGRPVYLFAGNPHSQGRREAWETFHSLCREGKVKAACAVEHGVAEAVMKMSFGNRIGFAADKGAELDWYAPWPAAIVAELTQETDCVCTMKLGTTTAEPSVSIGADTVSIDELLTIHEGVLEDVYPTRTEEDEKVGPITWTKGSPAVMGHGIARPRVVIPVFPGTNCEYDSARACVAAGMEAETVVIRNLSQAALLDSAQALEQAIRNAQIVYLPGGFSGGDEPEGSAKFIVSFLRSPRLTDAIHDLLRRRDGLMLGVCNGFQALVKLGLVPYGEIRDMTPESPTLTYNTIGRHQSSIVRTRVCSDLSPWLMEARVGEVYSVPISHGEGRFIALEETLKRLAEAGQIAAQYVDEEGIPSMSTSVNPNGSFMAIEAITSPDGRILGKMGHSERTGKDLYKNVPGRYDMGLFRSGARYFQ